MKVTMTFDTENGDSLDTTMDALHGSAFKQLLADIDELCRVLVKHGSDKITTAEQMALYTRQLIHEGMPEGTSLW